MNFYENFPYLLNRSPRDKDKSFYGVANIAGIAGYKIFTKKCD